MYLSFIRLDDRHYETLITRRDGVCYHVKGVGHMFAIPHDLAHLAVEEPLALERGFWGSVSDGAVFSTMTHVTGRRKPGAEALSQRLLDENRPHITEAEVLVGIFNGALEQGYGADSALLRARLREHSWTPPGRPARRLTDSEIADVCAAWKRMLELWQALPVGGTLEFEWSVESRRRGRSRVRA